MIARGLALVWEEWRRTRRAVVAVLLVIAACWPVVWSLENRRHGIALGALSGYGVFALLIYLLLSQSTRASIGWSVPARRYRLPASSFELAFWPLLYRLAVVSAGPLLLAAINRLIDADFPFFTPLFIFWLILSTLHTLAYASPLLGKWLPGLLATLMLFPGAAVFVRAYQAPWWRYPLYDFAGMAAMAGFALLITTAAISKTRRGGFQFAAAMRKSPARSDGAARAVFRAFKRPFRSAAGAQRWFEWRSVGRTVIILLAGLTLAFLLSQGSSSAYDTEAQYRIDPTLAMLIVLTNAAAAGLWAFANQSSRTRRAYSMFIQTRPVSDLRLARGKFETALTVILVDVAIVALALLAISAAVGVVKYGQAWANVFTVEWQLQHLLLVPATLCLAWVVYWRAAIIAASVIGILLFSEIAPAYFEQWIYSEPVVRPAALALMAVSLIVLAVPFLRTWRREILSGRMVAVAIVAWAAGTALATALMLRYAYPELDAWSALILNALLVLLALTPFARVPLRIANARHE